MNVVYKLHIWDLFNEILVNGVICKREISQQEKLFSASLWTLRQQTEVWVLTNSQLQQNVVYRNPTKAYMPSRCNILTLSSSIYLE